MVGHRTQPQKGNAPNLPCLLAHQLNPVSTLALGKLKSLICLLKELDSIQSIFGIDGNASADSDLEVGTLPVNGGSFHVLADAFSDVQRLVLIGSNQDEHELLSTQPGGDIR